MNSRDQVLPNELYAASDMPVNPIAWLVQDYLEHSALAVLFGPPGKGKLQTQGQFISLFSGGRQARHGGDKR